VPAPGASLTFRSFGLTLEVHSEDPSLLRRIALVLPPGWRDSPGERPSARFTVTRDGRIRCDGREAPDADPLIALERELRHHVALHAPDHVFIHAGVVAVGDAAIVIPGPTFTGKTTLVARLVDEGATYYSDEYAAVDAAGMIHPYPRPISLREPDGRRGVLRHVPCARIGTEPIPAGVTVITWYRSGARWDPRTVTPGEGALALLANVVPARSRPESSLAAVCALAAAGPVLIGARGEAAAATTPLLRVARRRTSPLG
jgi:hypothetical protein